MQGVETHARSGVYREETVQLARLGGARLAVEDGMHQPVGVVNIHVQAGRRSASSARMRLRASNSRDLTIFSSMSSTRAISS